MLDIVTNLGFVVTRRIGNNEAVVPAARSGCVDDEVVFQVIILLSAKWAWLALSAIRISETPLCLGCWNQKEDPG